MTSTTVTTAPTDTAGRARFVRDRLPPEGLFADHDWRTSPAPYPLGPAAVSEIQSLGRVLLQFYRAVNLLYRKSIEGKQPEWVARWLDQGKPTDLIQLQRSPTFKNDLPRVIRPDLLITDHGLSVTELDSVPGGIGLTAWLNQTYSALGAEVLGGPDGMLRGFASLFGDAPTAHLVVSEEAATYRPEMTWLAGQLNTPGVRPSSGAATPAEPRLSDLAAADPQAGETASSAVERSSLSPGERAGVRGNESDARPDRNECHLTPSRFKVRDARFRAFADGDAVYRFFELFDLPNVPNSGAIFDLAAARRIRLTPPPKPIFEEKMLFALLWNRNLRDFWRQELGESFFSRLLRLVPCTWIVDPAPLPPHAAIPELNLTDWRQLKLLSQKERDLILKVSGFSAHAWGARGVHLGSDLSHADWAAAVDDALAQFTQTPRVLQRYHKPALVEAQWFDFERNQLVPLHGRVRLCPYYFVAGDADAARAELGGVLATICPADKKIIHGMKDAIFAPCSPTPM